MISTDPEDSLKHLGRFLQMDSETNILLAADSKKGEGTIIQRLSLTKELSKDFHDIVSRRVRGAVDDYVIKPYDPGYRPDGHELSVANVTSIANAQELAGLATEIGRCEIFTEQSEVISRLRFYAVVVGEDTDTPAVFLRTYSPKKELTRSGVFAIAFGNGTYSKITQRLFLFDEAIDCFIWDQYVYIFSVPNFQKIFRYYDQIRASTSANVDLVGQHIPISNIEEFRTACHSQLPMMAKLQRIVNRPDFEQLTMEKIKKTISDFGIGLQIDTDGEVERLIFDPSLKTRWLILKILDDSFLESEMTDKRYEVNSKSVLNLNGARST